MALRFGLAEESFKLCTGHDIFQNDGAVYGRVHWRDAAACGLSMAFQVVVKSDVPALLVIGEQPAFHRRGITPVYRLEVSGPLPVTLRHIGMVTGDDCLQYGDILLSSPTVELEAAVPASVYVQVEVPGSCGSGRRSASERRRRSRRLSLRRRYLPIRCRPRPGGGFIWIYGSIRPILPATPRCRFGATGILPCWSPICACWRS